MALSPASLPRANQVGIDFRVLVFTLFISLLAVLIVGLIPALQASKIDTNEELKGSGKGTGDAGQRNRVRSMLMVSEIAISLVLLITAGLLVKSFMRLQKVSPGFDGENLLLVRLSLPAAKYPKRQAVTTFFEKVLPGIESLSGVESVAVANVLPLSGMNVRNDFTIAGRPPLSATDIPAAQSRWVSPGYFQTLGIQLVRGREFTTHDNSNAPGVVIIDEALAQRYWSNENPVGVHLKLDEGSPEGRDVEIVGVARNIKHVGLDEEPTATLYGPIDQISENAVSFLAANCSLAIRTRANPLTLEIPVRRVVQSVDNEVPTSSTRTMDQFLSASMAPKRFNVLLLTIFACVALLLAITGVYAVMSYWVTQRSQEIGIRIALGAQRGDVLKLVLGQGLKLVLIGSVIGLVGGFVATRFLSSLLFGVSAIDPIIFALTPLTLLLVALFACYIPAWKATKVDPLIALRTE
jgi:putative ABC transport system permease protein